MLSRGKEYGREEVEGKMKHTEKLSGRKMKAKERERKWKRRREGNKATHTETK